MDNSARRLIHVCAYRKRTTLCGIKRSSVPVINMDGLLDAALQKMLSPHEFCSDCVNKGLQMLSEARLNKRREIVLADRIRAMESKDEA